MVIVLLHHSLDGDVPLLVGHLSMSGIPATPDGQGSRAGPPLARVGTTTTTPTGGPVFIPDLAPTGSNLPKDAHHA